MRSLLPLLLVSAACAPPLEVLHAPGELGPFGVELTDRAFRARADAAVSTLVLAPTTEDGPLEDAPVALIIQGGAVPVESYRWMGERLASQGLVALLPRHALDLALFQSANALDALEGLDRASATAGDPLEGRVSEGPGLVLGHSLGGVLATSTWLRADPRLRHLVVFASQPNPGDEFTRDPGDGRVLSITGTADGRIPPDEVFDSYEAYPPFDAVDVQYAVVEGMNHFQLTDDPTESQLETDGEATLELDDARDAAFFLVDALAANVRGALDEPGLAALLDDPAAWPAALQPYTQGEATE